MENVFNFRDRLIGEYSSFSRSFSKIFARDISDKVEQDYSEGRYWPDTSLRLTRDQLRYMLDPYDVIGEDYPSEIFRILKT
jgi:hypothetical protein